MSQLEIEYFFPLEEQITLDLDYEPSIAYVKELNRKRCAEQSALSGQYLITNGGINTTTWAQSQMNSFVIKSEPKNVGKWEITSGMFVYRPTKPNAVIRFMAKILLGFKWHDEI